MVRVGPPRKWKETQEDVTAQKLSRKKVSPTERRPMMSSSLRPQMPRARARARVGWGPLGPSEVPGAESRTGGCRDLTGKS